MRIALVTESFAPDVNGVANSVARVAEELVRLGHTPWVIAPEPAISRTAVTGRHPYPVIRMRSLPLPGYRGLRLGLPGSRLTGLLRDFAPDVVHLASPFVLGAGGGRVAARLGVPSIAVYQTDVAAYARAYRVGLAEDVAWRWLRTIHNGASRTLAPSTDSASALLAHGIERVWRWGRGVDTTRFHPGKRSAALRAALTPTGEVLVGYVGRLAAEKRVDLLAPLTRRRDVRLVIVGDGPLRTELRRALPGALFLGERHGEQLARLYASLDVFVHPGPHETFGQTLQEAQASGVPVVAPEAGGPRDIVEPGTGILVPPNDSDALTEAVEALAVDPVLRKEYGDNARIRVEGRTWAAVTGELLNHYRAVTRPEREAISLAGRMGDGWPRRHSDVDQQVEHASPLKWPVRGDRS